MMREGTLEEISDGRLYGLNDMVRADCRDCKGCSACCRDMGKSIVLTPYDVYLLTTGLECSFEQLLEDKVELNMAECTILPNLKMAGEGRQCALLDGEGRCSVHHIRPGICRMFPLGRYYEDNGFHYFLQTGQCKNSNRGKVKVYKWLDTPDIQKNEDFIWKWHEFLKKLNRTLRENTDYEITKKLNMQMLQSFFFTPYDSGDFYLQFEERMKQFNLL